MTRCYCCGAEVPDNAKFCAKCGEPLEITQNLIDRAEAGDSTAQTELYKRTYKIVYAKTRAKISDEDTVMDIMQETYLRAFTNLDQLKKAETFPSWLLTIASRQACDWYRKNGKEQQNIQLSQLEYEDDDTLSDEDDLFDKPEDRSDLIPDEALERAETGRLLSEILDTLPEDQRMILTMFYYDDMSLNEISEELGVNLSTVKSRLTAGKKKVKAKVLELEKSGTKLYSLGPVAFLVYLLRHAELFAPEIPSNTILGLAGTGAAAGGTSATSVAGSTAAEGASTSAGSVASIGTSAGGTSSKIAGGTAAKASVAAAAKGISVRAAVAIVAAAVVVAGGGITTAVVVNNSSANPEPVSVSTITIEPSETDETTVIEPPSTETVMSIANYFAYTGDSSTIKNSDENDWIEVTFEDACDAAAAAVVKNNEDTTDYSSRSTQYPSGDDPNDQTIYAPISEEAVSRCLRNLFGSQYQLSDYTRDKTHSNDNGYSSSYQLIRSDDGTYWVTAPNADDGLMYTTPEVLSITPDTENDEAYIATIRYSYYYGEPESIYRGYRDITFRLKYDEGSDYNWVITAFKYGEFTQAEEETTPPSEEDVLNLADIVIHIWGANTVEYNNSGQIYLNTNQAVEMVTSIAFWREKDFVQDFESYYPTSDTVAHIIPASTVQSYMTMLFGSQFSLSDFSNTGTTSAFKTSIPEFYNPAEGRVSRNSDGDYEIIYSQLLEFERTGTNMSVESITPSGTDTYLAVVQFDNVNDDRYEPESHTMEFGLVEDPSADYGWAITSLSF